jgi:hypothetical protein
LEGATSTTVPEFGFCDNPSHCGDKVQDCDETGVDCGGSACQSCTPGIIGRVSQYSGYGVPIVLLILLGFFFLIGKRRKKNEDNED